jgi:hypothetical protein
MSSCGYVSTEGILPIIKHPLHGPSGEQVTTFLDVPFGPPLDSAQQPVLPGQCFEASTTYWRYGMKLVNGHNEAWCSNPMTASGLFVRLPEKNGLPMDLPNNKANRLSPIAEMERIIDRKPRTGFIFFRSGGNCTLKGQAPPSEAARNAGEGAFFEHEQSVKNPYNFGMEILAEQGTPVAVWGAGNLFPR